MFYLFGFRSISNRYCGVISVFNIFLEINFVEMDKDCFC